VKGHLRRRSQTSFEAKYDAPTSDGSRQTVYRTIKATTRRQAEAELSRLLTQLADGGHVSPSKLSVIEHVRNRVAHWHAAGVTSPKTHERYMELVEHQLARFPMGARPLQKLTAADVEKWHTQLRAEGRKNGGGVSTQTIGHVHRILVKALREGVRHGLVLKNVATEERPPKIVVKAMQILTPDQVKELPVKLAKHTICAPAVVALFTGLRRGELLALRWTDVDLDRKLIKIHAALEQTAAHGTRFKDPKTASGKRTIALPDIVVETLRDHRREQLETRLVLGLGRPPSNALVFPAPGTEQPWNPDTFSELWRDVAARLKLNVSFHALRHSHASQLIAAGVPITEISHRLGHASPAITLSVYAHLFERDNSKAAAAINDALGG
jgi:integrase